MKRLFLLFLATASSSSLRFRGAHEGPRSSSEVCVRHWYENLGNHLIILENALSAGTTEKLSSVWCAMDRTLEQVLDIPGGRVSLTPVNDTRIPDAAEKICSLDLSGATGFFRERNMTHRDLRALVQERLLRFRRHCPKPSDEATAAFGSDGIVMHMRSGDIMKHPPLSGFYAQPPCAYYRDVVGRGNGGKPFERVMLVTQADRLNPCVDELLRVFPDHVTVQSGSVSEDSCAIMNARNLALSYGTFSLTLSRLNSAPLRNLYVPFGEDNATRYPHHALHTDTSIWWRQLLDSSEMPYTQHIYTFPGFDTKARDSADMVSKMIKYPAASLVRRVVNSSS